MRACLVFLCLLAAAFTLSVKSKPHGKQHGLRKTSHTAKEKDIITEKANKAQVLPTSVMYEASSQEQEDEELSDKSTAVLLSEEELLDLLKKEAEEAEEAVKKMLEEDVEAGKGKEESGDAVEETKKKLGELLHLLEKEAKEVEEAVKGKEEASAAVETIGGEEKKLGQLLDLLKKEAEKEEGAVEKMLEEDVEADKGTEESGEETTEGEEAEGEKKKLGELLDLLKKEAEEEQEAVKQLGDYLETGKRSKEVTEEEEVKEESAEMLGEEDRVEEEVEKMSPKEKEETDGSSESEIPVDLDYAADSGVLQPLQIVSTDVKPHTDEDQSVSKPDVREKELNEKELNRPPTITHDYEQDIQNTEAVDSEESFNQDEPQEGKHDKDAQAKPEERTSDKKVPEGEGPEDSQEPKSGTDLESGSRLARKEEEKSKNDSGVHTKGKTRKQKKNQRARKHSPQKEEPQPGQEQSQQDPPESEDSSIDNTVHKAKRRRAGKWGPLVGMNPVQIRATVDLFPSSRPSLGGSIHHPEAPADPCDNFRCKRGKTCKLDADNKPGCVCQEPSECPPSVNEFDHVCGTDNKTYDTACELFATKCNLEGTKRGHRLHLDYTGPCKLLLPCVDTELVQFPLRMRDWLKNVLLQLYEHDSMSPGFLTPKQRFRVKKIFESERRLHAGDHSVELLAQDFEKNYNMYIYPVHWQFAQLDQHPSDRFLSHSELAPLRVPLVPMEHCTSRFFQECDADKDKQVSFKEWTSCFGIKNDDIDVNLLF